MIYHDYSYEQLETFAEELNKRYDPRRLTQPRNVDVFDIVDMLGARLAIDYLTPDRSHLGATTYKDGTLWIWPGNPYVSEMLPERKFYRAGTIIIDTDLDSSTNKQDVFMENYTVMHECFHFDKHQAMFEHSGTHIYELHKSNYDVGKNHALYKLERQADYAAAAFLMPKEAVQNVFCEMFHVDRGCGPIPFGYKTKPSIKELATLFQVNYSPMEYRLKDLGLLSKQFNSRL